MSDSRSLPDPVKIQWLKPTAKRVEVVVVSRWECWTSHWDVQARKSRRCGGNMCGLCALGAEKQLRFVVMVHDGRGAGLLELRERHRDVIEGLKSRFDGGPGATLRVQRAGAAVNSPVEISLLSREPKPVEYREIRKLVQVLGLPPLMLDELRTPMPPPELAVVDLDREWSGREDPGESTAEIAHQPLQSSPDPEVEIPIRFRAMG